MSRFTAREANRPLPPASSRRPRHRLGVVLVATRDPVGLFYMSPRNTLLKPSGTKPFPPIAPGFTGRGSLGCPRGRLVHLPGVGQVGEASRPAAHRTVCVCVQACPGHPFGDTSLTEVRRPAPDVMPGQKGTVTLCQSDFSGPRPPPPCPLTWLGGCPVTSGLGPSWKQRQLVLGEPCEVGQALRP